MNAFDIPQQSAFAARPKDALINAQYDTHCAIEKAKEAK